MTFTTGVYSDGRDDDTRLSIDEELITVSTDVVVDRQQFVYDGLAVTTPENTGGQWVGVAGQSDSPDLPIR